MAHKLCGGPSLASGNMCMHIKSCKKISVELHGCRKSLLQPNTVGIEVISRKSEGVRDCTSRLQRFCCNSLVIDHEAHRATLWLLISF
jgi:hypothetical protein